MNQTRGLRGRLSPLLYLSNNWISRIGVLLVTTAGILWLFLLPTYLGGQAGAAYIGIALFLILPIFFFGGLGLIPLGIWLKHRKDKTSGAPRTTEWPELTWKNPELQRLVAFIGVASIANVVIGANLSYRAVEYMDSVQFCGQSCHVVMTPEFTAYQNSPHSRVACVQCHIGPGASWFVQSKLSGAGQLIAVTFNTYPRPIPTPVSNLRPARDTCEGCHWPDKYGGNRLRIIPKYSDDGELSQTVLLMHIGGGDFATTGIHGAHLAKGLTIRYKSDPSRQTIPWVEYSKNGETREYANKAAKPEEIAGMATRVMDCVDCHNRPSHTFELPDRALDKAMASGEIAGNLTGIKKQALEAVQKEYATTEEAVKGIPAAFLAYYQKNQPELWKTRRQDLEKSAKGILAVYSRNVFPEMQVKWGVYPNNIGHTDFPGCFRCHDSEHSTKDDKVIEQDCSACHQILATEEVAPKVLSDLGVATAKVQ